MNGISFYLNNPKNVGIALLIHFGRWLPDRLYLKALFPLKMGYKLNLREPQTFAEKLQWLKLYDRKTIYHQMVDKVDSKSLINSILQEDYTVPTIGVYDSFEQIEWDALPQQFVLKATHDSGSFYIVKDKNKIDKQQCKKHLYLHWNKDLYNYTREWQYKGLKSRIIAEPLLVDSRYPYLRDFKFYCFNGEPKVFYITSDKGGNLPTRQDFFDIEGNHLELEDATFPGNPVKCPELPTQLDKMISLARKLAKETYHLRVDFYEIDGRIYVGELTLHEAAGFCAFKPDEWNYILGEWIHLPIDHNDR